MSCGSFELKSRVLSAKGIGSLYGATDAYTDYMSAHCYHQQKLWLYDSHLGRFHFVDVPCGNCYHCKETKINSWVTRMYAHCEDYQYVYFITLTYRGFSKSDGVGGYIMSRFADACWHYDNKNDTHSYGWHPCVLCKKHYQDFLKRLRKNTGISNISYVVSGEYGHKFGRPHFHMVLFSREPISRNDIFNAWSVKLYRDSRGYQQYRNQDLKKGKVVQYSLGRIDFNDLVENGTFNTSQKIKIDGTYYSGDKCFAYVCKYVCKGDEYNFFRVKLAYNSMYMSKTFVRLFESEVALDSARAYLDRCKLYYSDEQFDLIIKKFSYEKIVKRDKENVSRFHFGNLSEARKIICAGQKVSVEYYPSDFIDFRTAFAPFVEFSRGTPIGSLYAKAHIHEFVDGVFNCPSLQVKGFVVPSYFVRKASEYVFGIRRCRETVSGLSSYLGNLPIVRDDIAQVLAGEKSFGYLYEPNSFDTLDSLLSDSRKVVYEKTLSCTLRYLFPVDSSGECSAVAYCYDRKSRKYIVHHCESLVQWLQRYLFSIDSAISRHNEVISMSLARKRAVSDAENILESHFGCDIRDLSYDFLMRQRKYLCDRQQLYDVVHNSVE